MFCSVPFATARAHAHRPDEDQDDLDFTSDLYALTESSTDELLNSWKVFTVLKDDSDQHRRLENAAWRLHAMQRLQKTPTFEAASKVTGGKCAFKPGAPIAEQLDEAEFSPKRTLSGALGKVNQARAPVEMERVHSGDLAFQDSWAADQLLGVCLKNNLKNETIDDILQVLQHMNFQPEDVPNTSRELRELPHETRPVCAIFTHSLERNGANNFCLYIARLLKKSQPLTVFSPKAGPMKEDFEKLGLEVTIVDTTAPSFLKDLSGALRERKVGLVLANTIMRCDIILMAAELQMPSVWVIHESWPQDQLDHYAKEVFMCKDIDAAVIKRAFAAAGTIVSPSDMQRHLYDGMFRPEAGHTIYNGIPLQQLNQFKQKEDRRKVRAALGYTDEDFVVLHLGTVCSRKGQVFSATACSKLIQEDGCKNLKQLIVGARYIRDHEIKYIDEIFKVAASHGVSCKRWENLTEDEIGKPQITIMDIQAAVLRFYMAADVVLVASLNEVLPLVICESMAFERPVVCSDIDAIPEALTDGVEGYLVPPANADAIRQKVLKLYRDPELRRRMGQAGRARVLRQFSYEHMGERYRELLDTVRSSPSSVPVTQGLSELKGKTVLVDMDNTLVDWDGEFIRRFAKASGRAIEEVEEIVRNRKKFEIEENFPEADRALVLDVIASPGFYEVLEPLPGAVEALSTLVTSGVDVKLLSAPHPVCAASCAREKFLSVERLLGEEFLERLIITRDKTHVQGEILVDDKPQVTGRKAAVWKHVLFNQSYNQDVQGKVRMHSWSQWAETLPGAL
ncbi:Putative 5'(3')-deoxyribonucleotidase [Durusdinium trenchii]|uniref:5'(3')-deoxyribonucleotidase n=1 Tax=Durusdinium trenchii TaxID=1381693 RepID=A0ABP0MFX0_9DINO